MIAINSDTREMIVANSEWMLAKSIDKNGTDPYALHRVTWAMMYPESVKFHGYTILRGYLT